LGIFVVPTGALQAFIAAQTVGFILAIVLVVIPASRQALTAS
jgi:heme/copper-type cytochrome/quinol oxidase subunit 4